MTRRELLRAVSYRAKATQTQVDTVLRAFEDVVAENIALAAIEVLKTTKRETISVVALRGVGKVAVRSIKSKTNVTAGGFNTTASKTVRLPKRAKVYLVYDSKRFINA